MYVFVWCIGMGVCVWGVCVCRGSRSEGSEVPGVADVGLGLGLACVCVWAGWDYRRGTYWRALT